MKRGAANLPEAATFQVRWTLSSRLLARAPWILPAPPLLCFVLVVLAREQPAWFGRLETPAEIALWVFLLLPLLLLVTWKGTLAVSRDGVVLARGWRRQRAELDPGGVPVAKFAQPRLGVRGSVFFLGPLRFGAMDLLLEPDEYTREPCQQVDCWADPSVARALYDRLGSFGLLESSTAERGYRDAGRAQPLSFALERVDSVSVMPTMVALFGVMISAGIAGSVALSLTPSRFVIVSASLATLVCGMILLILLTVMGRRRAPGLELKVRNGALDLVRPKSGNVISSCPLSGVRATPARAVIRGETTRECMTLELALGPEEPLCIGAWGSPLRWTAGAPEGRQPQYNVGVAEWPKLLEVLGLADRAR